jgi:hypothetical protein
MVTAGMLREPWVLLIEDSPSDRELTMPALDRGRFDRNRTDHPRVILLDVTMPPVRGSQPIGRP